MTDFTICRSGHFRLVFPDQPVKLDNLVSVFLIGIQWFSLAFTILSGKSFSV